MCLCYIMFFIHSKNNKTNKKINVFTFYSKFRCKISYQNYIILSIHLISPNCFFIHIACIFSCNGDGNL